MGFRLPRSATAFANGAPTGQKRPRVEVSRHLEWIRTLPCLITGRKPVEACHIRYADDRYGKRETGKGEKPDDRWTVPMHPDLHRAQHAVSEGAFWDKHNIDPCRVAIALFFASGDDQAAAVILRAARGDFSQPLTAGDEHD